MTEKRIIECLEERMIFHIYRYQEDGYPTYVISPKGENMYELWTYPDLFTEYIGVSQDFIRILEKFKKEGFLIKAF
ncbi:MAG: hypothetical protein HPY57_12600 [Ignavibacteria bacterium]|nr:hypothetical protein [Ignavibacteria bacterium]